MKGFDEKCQRCTGFKYRSECHTTGARKTTAYASHEPTSTEMQKAHHFLFDPDHAEPNTLLSGTIKGLKPLRINRRTFDVLQLQPLYDMYTVLTADDDDGSTDSNDTWPLFSYQTEYRTCHSGRC
ncbi:hypothetical protein CSKR_103498 [Clonorchis sinensis]|uniref:Uncharacterized protein n=2 Tax=Clonorchis sinensis TaxID=79923 RepID=A0A8T1MI78_CLOSI|nr:hypothetical protein CSKR_103498 [Clonorchis sinensis]GAA55451.1 hypothetical protein CLF_107986 [Clonorchis sinensis]